MQGKMAQTVILEKNKGFQHDEHPLIIFSMSDLTAAGPSHDPQPMQNGKKDIKVKNGRKRGKNEADMNEGIKGDSTMEDKQCKKSTIR